jgi:hypothetical protein
VSLNGGATIDELFVRVPLPSESKRRIAAADF